MVKGGEKRRRKQLAAAAVENAVARQNEAAFRRYVGPSGEPLRRLRASDVASQPWLVWNEFVDLLAASPYEGLTPVQQLAWLAFTYDAEVQNGGHHQYFENVGTERVDATARALESLGATRQRSLLLEASQRHAAARRARSASVAEFVASAQEELYVDLDRAYFAAAPDMNEVLESYLKLHTPEFVVIEGAG